MESPSRGSQSSVRSPGSKGPSGGPPEDAVASSSSRVAKERATSVASQLSACVRSIGLCEQEGQHNLSKVLAAARSLKHERAVLEGALAARERVASKHAVRSKTVMNLTATPRAYLAECNIMTTPRRTVAEEQGDPASVAFLSPVGERRRRRPSSPRLVPLPISAAATTPEALEFETSNRLEAVRTMIGSVDHALERVNQASAATSETLGAVQTSASALREMHAWCQDVLDETARPLTADVPLPDRMIDPGECAAAIRQAKSEGDKLMSHVKSNWELVEDVQKLTHDTFLVSLAPQARWKAFNSTPARCATGDGSKARPSFHVLPPIKIEVE